jgi:hypothetical protein
MRLAFDQTDIASARALLRILRSEFDSLAVPQQFEYSAADRAAVEKMLDPTLIADEPEALVDEKSCNRPRWHNAASVRRVWQPQLSWNLGPV